MTDADTRWALDLAWKVARAMARGTHEAEDFAGEAILRLVRRDARYDPSLAPDWWTWAATQIYQGAIDAWRGARFIGWKRGRPRPELVKMELDQPDARAAASDENAVNLEQAWADIRRACASDVDRRIVEMRAAGMDHRAVGAVIGMSKTGVSCRIRSIRERYDAAKGAA